MRMRKIKEEMVMIISRIKEKLITVFIATGMKRNSSPSQSKPKTEKEKILMRFLYSNGILKRIGVVSVAEGMELENWWKQKQEIQLIEKSNARQRFRIQQLIGFSVIFNSMFKNQLSHVGHRRYIPENEFICFMTEASIILEEFIKKCTKPKSLRDITKLKVFLDLPLLPFDGICLETLQNKNISSVKSNMLPKTLQTEISEFYNDISDQENLSLNLINSCLSYVSELYCKAFSCNSSSICQKFNFYVQ